MPLGIYIPDDSHLIGASTIVLAGDVETALANNIQATVVTYTATAANTHISRISCSGNANAKWELFINAVLVETQRSGAGGLNIYFGPLKLTTSDIIDVKVTHYDTTETADFEATVYGE